jgi:hypothetical protein
MRPSGPQQAAKQAGLDFHPHDARIRIPSAPHAWNNDVLCSMRRLVMMHVKCGVEMTALAR